MSADLSRTQRRLLAMLASNGGAGVFRGGSPRLMILGDPGDQYARGPSACLTGLARKGLVLLGDGGMLHLTDEGRTAVAALAIPGVPVTARQAALADAARRLMEARNALAAIGGGEPWLSTEIPDPQRDAIDRLRTELKETWQAVWTASQGNPHQERKAA
jgi:hypothetical protein